MSMITAQEGTKIYYKDFGNGQPILFSHGWPLSSDAWDQQMLFFSQQGFRVIAHDRRGHGRSEDTGSENTMDRFADDLAEVIEQLDLHDLILIGHSTGGGEVTRYIGRHGTDRVAGVVLVSAIPPIMVKSATNPEGLPIDVFDEIRKGTMSNRSQFYLDLTVPFYGYNREGAKISEGVRQAFWFQAMMGGIKSQYDCIKEFSESDFHQDLRRFDVPTLFIHGDDDQIVPIQDAAIKAAKLVPGAELKVYPGGCHGLAQVDHDKFDRDVLGFIQAMQPKARPQKSAKPQASANRPLQH